jgi:hypothetical protein
VAYSDIAIRTDPASAQNIVVQAFTANGFGVTWQAPLKGVAEKGSKGANIALGALAQYYGIDFEVHPQPHGVTLRLIQKNTGMAGGLLGVSAVKKKFASVSDQIANWMQINGMLLAYTKGK